MKLQNTMPAALRPRNANRLAQGLGWFSILLGMGELMAPRTLSRWLDTPGGEPLLGTYGLREIATGIAILGSRRPGPWVWARVAGDALDIATLMTTTRSRQTVQNRSTALAAVLGVTALDILCATSLQQTGEGRQGHARRIVRDYSRRSGFRKPTSRMRGAASDFVAPEDFRTPKLLRDLQ